MADAPPPPPPAPGPGPRVKAPPLSRAMKGWSWVVAAAAVGAYVYYENSLNRVDEGFDAETWNKKIKEKEAKNKKTS